MRVCYPDYDNPSESHVKDDVIDKREAYTLAKDVNVPLIQLPAYMAKKYGVQYTMLSDLREIVKRPKAHYSI